MQAPEISTERMDAMQSVKHWGMVASQPTGTLALVLDILQDTHQLLATVFIRQGPLILRMMTGVEHMAQLNIVATPCTIAIVKVRISLVFMHLNKQNLFRQCISGDI